MLPTKRNLSHTQQLVIRNFAGEAGARGTVGRQHHGGLRRGTAFHALKVPRPHRLTFGAARPLLSPGVAARVVRGS